MKYKILFDDEAVKEAITWHTQFFIITTIIDWKTISISKEQWK